MVKRISDTDFDSMSNEEIFFVDTNVLFAVHFLELRWEAEKVSQYANFILGLLKNGNKICVSALNLQELFHLVENNEFRQYKAVNHLGGSFNKKMYREIEEERTRLAQDLQNKYLEISEQYSVVSGNITGDMIKQFLDDYNKHFFDPIDFLTVKYNSNDIVNFITDDSDFKKYPEINVYTYE